MIWPLESCAELRYLWSIGGTDLYPASGGDNMSKEPYVKPELKSELLEPEEALCAKKGSPIYPDNDTKGR